MQVNADNEIMIGLVEFRWLKGGANFLDQSQSEIKQNQSNPGSVSTLN